MKKVNKYKRKAVSTDLELYDNTAGEMDFIEVTEWDNKDGFDVEIVRDVPMRFQLTLGAFKALKKLVKKL